MLNLTDISLRIAHPEMCEISDFNDLTSFAAQYPYCQVFPILALKTLANHNDIRFDVELAHYAYRISDRAQLYSLIHQNVQSKSSPETVVDEAKTKPSEEPIVESVEKTDDVELAAEIEEIHEEIVNTNPELEPEGNTSLAEASISEQEAQSLKEVQQPIISGDDEEFEDENEAEFIPLNISSSEEVIHAEAKTEELESTLAPEEEVAHDVVTKEHVTEIEDSDDLNDFDDFERSMLAETISAAYRLEELEPENIEETNEYGSTEENELQESSQNRSFTDWLRVGNQSSANELDEDKSHLDDLLDRFIENEPKISRPNAAIEDKPKRPFYSPEKKAKESVDMQHMPVSETLGTIFELQGNFPKAIFVYEQLILANPEKKSYFAARILELNKKINS
jgi:hypothetical protein